MGRLGADLEEKQEPRVASLAEAQKPKRQRVMHEVTRARLDTGRDREETLPVRWQTAQSVAAHARVRGGNRPARRWRNRTLGWRRRRRNRLIAAPRRHPGCAPAPTQSTEKTVTAAMSAIFTAHFPDEAGDFERPTPDYPRNVGSTNLVVAD